MAIDLILAVIHHLLVFTIFAIFAAQMSLVRPGLGTSVAARLARLDAAYGALSVAIIAAGFARAIWGLKGWDYYALYWVFWAKVSAFALVGLLSIRPTQAYRRWQRTAASDSAYEVAADEIAAVRPWLHRQGVVMLVIPILAAMMARGVFY
jgi:putative membrane protein